MKKRLSKMMVFIMAVAMILGVNTTAFAATGTGTIRINNTTPGKSIEFYQIFSADVTDATHVVYTLNMQYKGFFATRVANGSTLSDAALSDAAYTYVEAEQKEDSVALATDLLDWTLTNIADLTKATTLTPVDGSTEATTDPLDFGYYLAYPRGATDITTPDSNTKSPAMLLDLVEGTLNINMKSTYPTVDKVIINDENANVTEDDDSIGDTVTYLLTSAVPDMTGYSTYTFVFKDTLSAGLTYASGLEVKIGQATLTEEDTGDYTYKVSQTGQNLTVTINNMTSYTPGTPITVQYNATINANAQVGTGVGNTNSASIEYSNDPSGTGTGESTTDVTKVYTFAFNIFKYTTNGTQETALSGAEFRLYSDEACRTEIEVINKDASTYRPKLAGETGTVMTSDANGIIHLEGLGSGTYYLKETTAPAGYNPLVGPVRIDINATYNPDGTLQGYAVAYNYNGTDSNATGDPVPQVKVLNKTGQTLPSTGSRGAIIITIAGVLLFAVVLGSSIYSKKKKSKNN